MWRSKKFLVIAILAVVLVAGSIGGVVLAQTDNQDGSTPASRQEAMLDRVCEIYNAANPDAPIDSAALKAAFTQFEDEQKAAAQERMAQAQQAFRQKLIDEGKVTQEQLDAYDAWLKDKPDIDIPIPFGPEGHGMRPFGGFGGPGGGFHRWGGPPCAPAAPEE